MEVGRLVSRFGCGPIEPGNPLPEIGPGASKRSGAQKASGSLSSVLSDPLVWVGGVSAWSAADNGQVCAAEASASGINVLPYLQQAGLYLDTSSPTDLSALRSFSLWNHVAQALPSLMVKENRRR